MPIDRNSPGMQVSYLGSLPTITDVPNTTNMHNRILLTCTNPAQTSPIKKYMILQPSLPANQSNLSSCYYHVSFNWPFHSVSTYTGVEQHRQNSLSYCDCHISNSKLSAIPQWCNNNLFAQPETPARHPSFTTMFYTEATLPQVHSPEDFRKFLPQSPSEADIWQTRNQHNPITKSISQPSLHSQKIIFPKPKLLNSENDRDGPTSPTHIPDAAIPKRKNAEQSRKRSRSGM